MNTVYLFSCLFAFWVAIVLSVVPPIGDVNCKPDSCDGVVCQSFNCSYGKVMNSPKSPCSCCKICMQYIGENEICGINYSDRECGPGLTCTRTVGSSKPSYKCTKMDTACFRDQNTYEEKKKVGSLGMYETRPNCDSNGDFVGRKCQPNGSCYCINKSNNRIFGESASSESAVSCDCSRDYDLALKQELLRNQQFPHCLPNGNYDALQCINQACFCIDSGSYMANSDIVPFTSIQDLPCYKPEVHYVDYYRPCEKELSEVLTQINVYAKQNITILSLDRPICSPDGYYTSIRETESTIYCANPFGQKIEEFEIDKESPSATSINCYCARARYWLGNQNLAKPICCGNGNYRSFQCKGGVCFCVNSSGDQVGLEVKLADVSSLKCEETC